MKQTRNPIRSQKNTKSANHLSPLLSLPFSLSKTQNRTNEQRQHKHQISPENMADGNQNHHGNHRQESSHGEAAKWREQLAKCWLSENDRSETHKTKSEKRKKNHQIITKQLQRRFGRRWCGGQTPLFTPPSCKLHRRFLIWIEKEDEQ
jgi:hypothetical protein